MQRTGGTSLTDLLMALSEHRSAEHEPFNWARKQPRQFWPITDAWNTTKNVEVLRASLEGLFAQRYLIKHCYELLSMSFNMHLMQVAAETPYRHILLMRRDETSRLVSKFVAEAQGTWFKDYSRKVFSEVAEGERRLEPLPVDRVVAHFHHSQQSTKFIGDTLRDLRVEMLPVYFEDLYTGEREARLGHLRTLFDFLDFKAADLEPHRQLIEDKVFHSGQNTPSVAPHIANLAEILEALRAAGCNIEESILANTVGLPAASGPSGGPGERQASECAALAQAYACKGPFLEIGSGLPKNSALLQPIFAGQERRFLTARQAPAPEGIVAEVGNGHDMRSLFGDASFGTVLWTGLVQDKKFWLTLEEIKRVLIPGGALIVVAPAFGKNAGKAGITINGPKGNPIADSAITLNVTSASDYWRISQQTMQEVVLDGFNVREIRTMMMPPRLFAIAVKS